MPRVAFGPGSSLGLLATLIGGEYRYDANGNAWIQPIDDLYSRPLPRFDPTTKPYQQMRACQIAQLASVKGRAFVNPPIWLDPLTTLSLLRTVDQLCLDLMDRPDDVQAVVRRHDDGDDRGQRVDV